MVQGVDYEFSPEILTGDAPSSITCPPDVVINCTDDYNDLLLTGEASTNCPNGNIIYEDITIQIGDCSDGFIERQFTETISGLSCIQFITILESDTLSPIFSGGCNIPDVCVDNGSCTATVNLPQPAIDDCDNNITFSISSPWGNGFGPYSDIAPGIYPIIYIATDACGNFNTCESSVEVLDCNEPTADCLNGIVLELIGDPPEVELFAVDLDNLSTDNCSNTLDFSFSSDINDQSVIFNCSDIGIQTVQLWVSDEAGNQVFCETDVTIVDNLDACSSVILPLTTTASSGSFETGEQFCVDISVENFDSITTMQYSMNWDTAILQFEHTQNYNLNDLNTGNFGTTQTSFGRLTFSWSNPLLNGISLIDGTLIYQVCFTALNCADSQNLFSFSSLPLGIEITAMIDGTLQEIPSVFSAGSIAVTSADFLANVSVVNTSCGQSNGTATVTASEGSGNYTYQWSNNSMNATLTGLDAGTYSITVSDGGCQTIASGIVGFSEAPTIEWEYTYGGSEDETLNQIIQTTDSGYAIAGRTRSADGDVSNYQGEGDYWIVKLDENGAINWETSFGGSNNDLANAIVQTSDSGFFVIGNSASTDGDIQQSNGGIDCWVVKLDSVGNLEWENSLGGSANDYGRSGQQTSDGGYIVAGQTWSSNGDVNSNNGQEDFWIVKLNPTGDIEWEKNYGGTLSDGAFSIEQTMDGGYVAAGYSQSSDGDVLANNGGNDYWIIKIDTAGNITWEKNYGGTGQETIAAIRQTSDQGFIISGTSDSSDGDIFDSHGGNEAWVVKLDADGNLVWEQSLGGSANDYGRAIQFSDDGSYILCGQTWSSDGNVSESIGMEDFWVVKLNSAGGIEWENTYGGTSFDGAFSIQQSADGGIIAGGYTHSTDVDVSTTNGETDYWVVKLSAPHLPETNLGADTTICGNEMIVLTAYDSLCSTCTYSWNDGNTDSVRIVTPVQATTYSVTVTDQNGCTAFDSIEINSSASQNITQHLTSCNPDDVGMQIQNFTNQNGCDSTIITITSLASVLVKDSILLYLPFNGNANDESGNEYHGQVGGPTLIANRFGKLDAAFDFDGLNDSIGIASIPSQGSFSVSVWAYNREPYVNKKGIIDKYEEWRIVGEDASANEPWLEFPGIESAIFFTSFNRVGTGYITSTINEWHHIVFTYDDITQQLFLFVDNNLVSTADISQRNFNDNRILIGAKGEINNTWFDGIIDDIRIYNRAITSTEVEILFNEIDVPPTIQDTTICQGGVLMVGNDSYSESGTYINIFMNSFGCDSTVITNLTVSTPINLDLGNNISTCTQSTVELNAYVPDCISCNYEWNDGNTDSIRMVTPAQQTTTYVITVTDQEGCTAVDSIEVEDLETFTVNDTVSICSGETYMVGDSLYTQTGTYQNNLTTLNGCDSIVVTELTVTQLAPIDLGEDQTLCEGESVMLDATVSNCSNCTYQWSDGSIDPVRIVTPSTSTIYSVTATVANLNNCFSEGFINISVLSGLAPIDNIVEICIGENYTIGNNTYNSSGIFMDTLTAVTTGCDSIIMTDLSIIDLQTNLISDTLICSGESILLDATVPNCISCTYDWDDNNVSAIRTVSPSQTSIYSLTITNNIGCSITASSNLSVEALEINLGLDSTVCNLNDNPLTLEASNAEIYIWSTSENSQSIIVNQSGVYAVTITSTIGCTAEDSINIEEAEVFTTNDVINICLGEIYTIGDSSYTETGTYQNIFTTFNGCDSIVITDLTTIQLAPIDLGDNQVICAGDSILLDATLSNCPSCNYEWNDGSTDPIRTVTPNASVVYSVTATFVNLSNCPSEDLINIAVIPELPPIDNNIEICIGDDYSVGNNIYSSTGIFVDTIASILTGCDSIIVTNLNVIDLQTDLISDTLICPNEPILLDATVPNCTNCNYEWDDSNTDSIRIINPSETSTYTLTITHDIGCSITATVFVNVQLPLSAPIFTGPSVTCEGEVQNYILNDYNPDWIYNIQAPPGATVSLNNNSFNIDYSGVVSGDLCVSITDNCGIESLQSCQEITVNLLPPTPVDIIGNITPCEGSNESYSVIIGNDIDTINWFTPLGDFQTNDPLLNIDWISLGAGQICVSTVNSCGEGEQYCENVNIQALPSATLTGDQEICEGETADIVIEFIGSGPWEIIYSTGGVPVSLQDINDNPMLVSVSPIETTFYELFNVSSNGCEGLVNGEVTIVVNEVYSTILDTIICQGESLNIDGQIFDEPGFYSITLQSSENCDSILDITLVESPLGIYEILSICPGETTPFCSELYSESGIYYCTYFNEYDCEVTDTLELWQEEISSVFETVDDHYIFGGSDDQHVLNILDNDSKPNDNWFFEITILPHYGNIQLNDIDIDYTVSQDNFSGQDSFEYQICLESCPELCDTAWVFLFFENDCFRQAEENIPSGFTPGNQDGINDRFDPLEEFILLGCPIDPLSVRLRIVNRWGEVIFDEKPYPNNGFDGRRRRNSSKFLPQGTYYYTLIIPFSDGSKVINGPLNLLN